MDGEINLNESQEKWQLAIKDINSHKTISQQ